MSLSANGELSAGFLPLNKDNNPPLLSLFESIGDQPMALEASPEDRPRYLLCHDVYRVVGDGEHRYILAREQIQKRSQVSLTISDLQVLCPKLLSDAFIYFGESTERHLADLDAFRLVAQHTSIQCRFAPDDGAEEDDDDRPLRRKIDQVRFKVPPSSIPIFLPQTSRWTLADVAQANYPELLCLQSMLSYSIGQPGRYCAFCTKSFDSGIMHPMTITDRDPTEIVESLLSRQATLQWMCHGCYGGKLRSKDTAVRVRWNSFIHGNLIAFPMWAEVHKPEQLTPKLEIIEANISFLREHLIGWLRQMTP